MTCVEALQYIEELKPGGMKLGLDRMRRGLELLGHPERRLRVTPWRKIPILSRICKPSRMLIPYGC